jgi:hypothetical protein
MSPGKRIKYLKDEKVIIAARAIVHVRGRGVTGAPGVGPAHLVLVPHHVRIRVLQVQGALAARSSNLRSDARKALEGLKERKSKLIIHQRLRETSTQFPKLLQQQKEDC